MSIREEQKNTRRRAILDAARSLILEGKERDFSMLTLAEKAGVSLVTPYNLFGSKSSILLEIVREDIYERITHVEALASDSLAEWVAALSATLGQVYYKNRHFYRRMIVTLVAQQNADTQRASLEFSYRTFENALKHLRERGILPGTVPVEVLARQFAHSVSGSLQQRLMQRGTEELLRREIELGLLFLLAGVCADTDRQILRDRINELARSPG
jgi:AcrR family transcriptional regulator